MKSAGLLVFLFSAAAFGKGETTMVTERGLFSVGLGAGAGQQRLLNSTGGYSSFSGAQFGANFDLRLMGDGQGELRAFAELTSASLGSKDSPDDLIKQSVTLCGFKSFFRENIYVGAGYGNIVQKITTAGSETSFSNSTAALGVGYEHGLGPNVFLGAHFWYQNNPIRNEGTLTGNSFSEGARVFLNLIWSPPVMTTIVNR